MLCKDDIALCNELLLYADLGGGEDKSGGCDPTDSDSRASEAGSTESQVHARDSAAGGAREESGGPRSSDARRRDCFSPHSEGLYVCALMEQQQQQQHHSNTAFPFTLFCPPHHMAWPSVMQMLLFFKLISSTLLRG